MNDAQPRERLLRLVREGFWVSLGQAAAVLGSLFGVRLMTELLDPRVFGELALCLTISTLVNQAVLGPLANGITRYYAPAMEKGDLAGYLRDSRTLVARGTGITIALLIAALGALALSGHAGWVPVSAAASVFAVFSGWNAILSGIQNAARQRSVVALHQGMEPWARFAVAACIVLLFGRTSASAMVGYAIGASVVLSSQYLFVRKILRSAGTPGRGGWRGPIWTYSWPFASWGILGWAQQASDRWALQLFGTSHEVGLYAVLFQLGYYPISLATGVAMQFLAPIYYQRAGDATDQKRNADVSRQSWRFTGLTLGGTALAFALALLLHRPIFRLLAAAEYGVVSHLLPWMVLAGGIFAAGQAIALDLMSRMRVRAMMVAKNATAILGVGLNLLGAYWGRTPGVVTAAVSFSTVYFLWMVALQRATSARTAAPSEPPP